MSRCKGKYAQEVDFADNMISLIPQIQKDVEEFALAVQVRDRTKAHVYSKKLRMNLIWMNGLLNQLGFYAE